MSDFINPYSFYSLPATVPRRPVETSPGWARLGAECCSGYLQVEIITLTRLFIPSRRQQDMDLDFTNDKEPKREHPVFKKFLYDGINRKMIPGTSVKGPVRSVIEALSDSCMGLYAGKYKRDRGDKERRLDYGGKAPADTLPGRCRLRAADGGSVTEPDDGLCISCRLFGIAAGGGAESEAGEYTALQGRVTFEDFLLVEGKVSATSITLPELSDPKLWHRPFYLDAAGNIQGRKFYWHHDPANLHTKEKSKGNRTIEESIPPKACFTGRVRFSNLTAQELGLLLWGLELDDLPPFDEQGNRTPNILAHKLGMGKPLGLGSVKMRVEQMALLQASTRYAAFSWPEKGMDRLLAPLAGTPLRQEVERFKAVWATAPFHNRDQLHSLLTFPAGRALTVGYPKYNWFPCSHIGLPPDGVLPSPCPNKSTTGHSSAAPSGLSVDLIPPGGGKSKKARPKKSGPQDVMVEVIEVAGNKVIVEVEGQSVSVPGISSYLGIKPQDNIKVRVTPLPDGRIKAEFKGKV